MRATLRPKERIRKHTEFERLSERGARAAGRFLTILALPNTAGMSRLGIIATRKLGGAVRRNLAKRLIREVFRRNKPAENVDLVIIARPELPDVPISVLEGDYRATLARLRWSSFEGPSGGRQKRRNRRD